MSVRGMVRGFGPLLALLSVAGILPLASEIHAAEKPPENSVAALAGMLDGTFQGSNPGNDLTIVSTLHGSPTLRMGRLELRVTGTYNGDAVLLRGLWRVSYQGDAVWLVFIPGVDPVDAGRFSDPTFSPTELEAGCWSVLTSRNGSFEGAVKTFPNCRNALKAGEVQSVGKEWSARFSTGQMRFENRETGEILSFSRAAAKPRD